VSGPPDAGAPGAVLDDSGAVDRGTADSGTADSGTADSPTSDSGTADSPTADSPTADSPTADSLTADSLTADSGTGDAGAVEPSDRRPLPAQAGEAPEVVAFWRDLGLPGLIDMHTHFMPDNVLAKVWAFFEDVGDGRSWPVAYRLPEPERLALLRAFGLRRFTALLYPHKPDMAAWLNSWAVEFAARVPDALHTATFFPEPTAARYVAQAIADGARVFKAHVQVGAYDPRDDLLTPVWGQLAEAGLPVVVHCGSGPAPGRYTGPGPFGEVLARHPRLAAIIAHMGAPEYGEFLDLAERYPRTYLDTTIAFTDFFNAFAPFPAGLLPRLADRGDRILLGTDFPNIPHTYLHQLQALERLGLGPAWLRAVCHDNAARLLGR
jgi:uncharacterized protein